MNTYGGSLQGHSQEQAAFIHTLLHMWMLRCRKWCSFLILQA